MAVSLEQFGIVRVNLGTSRTIFLTGFLSALLDDVAERNDFTPVIQFGQSRHML